MAGTMNREVAFGILGLSDAVAENEIHSAYWALRAHVERRAQASEHEEFRSERAAELRDLDEALRVAEEFSRERWASQAAAQTDGLWRAGRHQRRWLVAWASAATLLLLLSLALLSRREGLPILIDAADASPGPAGPVGSAPGSAPDPLARLAARANLDGARLEIEEMEAGRLIAESAADGSDHWLEPGDYRLAVHHPDCPDTWVREVSLSSGQELDLTARNCTNTGWIVVRSNVVNDRLMINGRDVGQTGPALHAVTVGEHHVRVQKTGYESWEGLAQVQAAKRLTLRAELAHETRPEQDAQREQLKSDADQAQPGQGDRPPLGELLAGELQQQRQIAERGWHGTVTHWMVARYDTNRSESIDTAEEVASIPCDDLLGLERSLAASGLVVPLTRLYGFDGRDWVENALGFDASARDLAYARMKECGLQ